MFRRPQYIAAALVAVLALALLSLPNRTADRLKLAIGSLFVPLFGLAGGTEQTASAAVDALTPRRELLRLNDILTRENQRLKLEVAQAAEINRENARLRELIGWRNQTPWKLKLANVISRDPASWWRTIQIDLGTQDGLRENLAVRTTDGLVGRISSVGRTRSQVVLVGDPNCNVAAMVENQIGDQGVVSVASGPFDGSMLAMNYLSRSAAVKPGQRVVTSGEGGVFPKGIPIGNIAETRPVEFGLALQAQVKLAANLGALEEVWVILP